MPLVGGQEEVQATVQNNIFSALKIFSRLEIGKFFSENIFGVALVLRPLLELLKSWKALFATLCLEELFGFRRSALFL